VELFAYCLYFLLLIIFVMVGVASLNLLEPTILGYIHLRTDPNIDQYFQS